MGKTGLKRTDLTDAQLICLAIERDEAAAAAIFDRYKDGVKVFVSKMVPSSDVEDVVMQSFLKALMKIETYDETLSSFKTWLYTIAWNTALDFCGKRKRDNDNMPITSIDTPLGEGVAVSISDPQRPVDEQISNAENYDSLLLHIEGLSPLYRDIARDRFVCEHEYEEIALRYGLSLNTVKTRIRRAKEILQREMEEDGED